MPRRIVGDMVLLASRVVWSLTAHERYDRVRFQANSGNYPGTDVGTAPMRSVAPELLSDSELAASHRPRR